MFSLSRLGHENLFHEPRKGASLGVKSDGLCAVPSAL
jgi:hypothetical protein